MKALLCHCKNYSVKIDELSNRPKGIKPEKIEQPIKQQCKNCVVALITIEKEDKFENTVPEIVAEIKRMCADVGSKTVALLPFAHLSNNIADSQKTITTIDKIDKGISDKYSVIQGHFGSHKSLLLDIHGHPGNVRFREF